MTIFWLEVPIVKGLDVKPSLEKKQPGVERLHNFLIMLRVHFWTKSIEIR